MHFDGEVIGASLVAYFNAWEREREREREACSARKEREFLKFLNRGKLEEERGETERAKRNEGHTDHWCVQMSCPTFEH